MTRSGAGSTDKKRGRLNIISHLLSQVPYEPLPKDGRLPSTEPHPACYPDTVPTGGAGAGWSRLAARAADAQAMIRYRP